MERKRVEKVMGIEKEEGRSTARGGKEEEGRNDGRACGAADGEELKREEDERCRNKNMVGRVEREGEG
ncbi:hypothetical protein [Escherichia coli]|uniref:hypothetical protein n=1 Tax=Escherichia coli TaxID=562 RepID=UPI00098AE1CE